MDIIDLREKNLFTNLKYMAFIVACGLLTCILPNMAIFMKMVLTVIFLSTEGAIIWATFFIKNEIIFYDCSEEYLLKNKLIFCLKSIIWFNIRWIYIKLR